LRAQHKAQVCHRVLVLVSDLLSGLRRGFQVSAGGGEVADLHGGIVGVVVQEGVNEMVAGSFGAGERFGVQRQAPPAVQVILQLPDLTGWTVGEHADRAHTDHDLTGWVDDGSQPRSNPRRG
jgi:hypothetical protein